MSEDFMSGGDSNPSIKFTSIGDKATGTVLRVEKREDLDFITREVRTWPSGDKRYIYLFELETSEGIRSLYVKGFLEKAIKEAGRAALVKTLVGCTLTVEFIGLGESKTKGFAAPKLFKAHVKPAPVSSVTVDDLLG
jgi:hypothetical protein